MLKFSKLNLFQMVLVVFWGSMSLASNDDLQSWRLNRETSLKAPGGWLSVVGLEWLKPGVNKVGHSFSSSVRLPKSAPAELGELHLKDEQVEFTLRSDVEVFLDDQKLKTNQTYALKTDKTGPATRVKMGSIEFFILDRKNGFGVRIIDNQAKAIKTFKGLSWFNPSEKFRIKAKWIKLDPPKKLFVPDVLGNVNEELAPGFARFDFEGKTHSLYPTLEGDQLFFVFRDKTSGKETYGASRFLYAELPKQGDELWLDFNRAYNPPCAVTDYATCPKAPQENILDLPVLAGERYNN